jgi:fructose-1,6-bisphosphatase/inositol monophosphatase family enzyme
MSIDCQKISDSHQLVVDVFKGFRSELMREYGVIGHTRKADMSQVTELDIRIEQTLKDRLAEVYPELGFQGEETGKFGNEEHFWLVDPIDGTSSFIRGLPFCTNMAALIDGGQSVAAVIYDFVNDVLYTAVKDEGAYKNQQRMHIDNVRKSGNLSAYSLTSFRFNDLSETMLNAGIKCFYPIGAAGHAYAMLAEGKIDGVSVLNTKTGAHDNAPGILLVKEAGGDIISFDGRDDIYVHEFIVGSPLVTNLIERYQDTFRTLVGR